PICEEAVAFTLGSLQELEFFALFAQHFHVEVTVGFDPVLMDLDSESSNEPQRALLVGKDANDMGAALDLLIESLQHIGAFEMLVVSSRQSVEGQSFLDVLLDPRTEGRILFLPAQQPSRQVSARFLGVASIVEP